MTDRPWLPDHPVDEPLARRLVETQFPALAGCAPIHLGRGFDNDVWRFRCRGAHSVSGDWVFRFPRRAVGVELIAVEMRVMPALASRLPVAVPMPEMLGVPVPEFPHPFYGHRYMPGTTGDRARLDAAGRTAIAAPLGRFLRALHAIDVAEARALGVPEDTFRGDLPGRQAKALARLPGFENSPWATWVPAMRTRLEALPPTDPDAAPVVLHGDMYARHLVLDEAGGLAGVIDWGDVCVGDRAVDLAVAFGFLPAPARPAFWAAYGPVDAATVARAEYLALARHGVYLGPYALDVGDEPLLAESGVWLENLLS